MADAERTERFDKIQKHAIRRPLRLLDGVIINRVQVVHVVRVRSFFYDMTHANNKLTHLNGEVECKCLVCGKLFTTAYTRLCVNNPKRSLWSCGCQHRPFGSSAKAGAANPDRIYGRQPNDLTGRVFGSLEPMTWLSGRSGRGWLCLCHRCGNTDGCVVPESRLLTKGTVTACSGCAPEQWQYGRRASADTNTSANAA